MNNCYATGDSIEGQFQPGSHGKVLQNKLDIIDPAEIELDSGKCYTRHSRKQTVDLFRSDP